MKTLVWLLLLVFPLSAETPLTVTRGDIETNLVLTGRIKAVGGEKLTAPITDNWQIAIDWMVPEGHIAQPGEVVVRFNNKEDRLRLDQLQQDLTNAEAKLQTEEEAFTERRQQFAQDLESSRLDLALAEIDARVPAELQQRKEYEQKQLDQLKAKRDLALKKKQIEIDTHIERNNLEKTRIQIRQLREEIRQQQDIIAKLSLKTKNGGVVIYADTRDSSRKLTVGDSVYAGSTIVTIPKLDALELETWLTEQEWVQVKRGMKVSARLDAYPEHRLSGKVHFISEQAKPKARWSDGVYYHTLIALDHVDLERMKPGMSAQTNIHIQQHHNVWLVPLEAVSLQQGKTRIRTKNGSVLTVQPLAWDAFHMAVAATDGLQEGLRLVPAGQVGESEVGP